jgi:hypothetical protein
VIFIVKQKKLKVYDKYKIFYQNCIYYNLGPDAYSYDFKLDHGSLTPAWWWGIIMDFL